MAPPERIRLLCDGRLVGHITDVRWQDFPWLTGTFAPAADIDADIRTVLEWFAGVGDREELVDPPFDARLLENWSLESDGGERRHVDVPIVDFDAGTIQWV